MMEVEQASTTYPVVNQTGLDTSVIMEDPGVKRLHAELSRWADETRDHGRRANMFDRRVFTPPDSVYHEIKAARKAVESDDIVSGVAEITESFAFQGVKWESENPDDSDVFNQMAADQNLDAVLRRMWREEFTASQVVIAVVWGWKEYTIRGRMTPPKDKKQNPDGSFRFEVPVDDNGVRRKGPKRKKKVRVWCPVDIRVLDSAKIVPIQSGPLGQERLAWQATEWEIDTFQLVQDGTKLDVMMSEFYLGTYTPDPDEDEHLRKLGVDTGRLLELNPKYVQRHTLTKADYERFADVRLKSCFALLDLKQQLLASDRAALVGSANYILLVKKGSKDEPAQQSEIDNLKSSYSVLARLPVIISDHRLSIEIVAPKVDLTLNQEKYDVVDTRLMSRLIGTLSLGSRGQRNETNLTISHAIAKNLENRRHMMKRFLERMIARAVVQDPRNEGIFEDEPNLVFTPRVVSLGYDSALMQAILSLRTQREVSRETILEYMGLNQTTEAMRMEVEGEIFDDIFKTRQPFDSPAGQPSTNFGQPDPQQQPEGKSAGSPQADGAKGGRPPGGGGKPTKPNDVAPKTPAGNKSTGKGGV